jgi:peptidoglycan/LPS O-acetylase OafA/YrhL
VSPTLPDSAPRRVDGIDLLRGVSIVLVVLHHVNLHMAFANLSFAGWLPKPWARILFWNGQNGVLIFFAVSGFLITTNARRRWGSLERPRLREFYLLRAVRILPLLLVVLAVLSALHLAGARDFVITPSQCSLTRAVVAALVFHVNALESAVGYLPANWDVLWSLAVEEVFYLGLPLACLLLRRQRWIVAALLMLVAVAPLARVHYGNSLWAEYGYLCRMDAISFGCLAAIAAPRLITRARLLRNLAGLGLALMLFSLVVIRWWHLPEELRWFLRLGLDDSTFPLGVALLLPWLTANAGRLGWPSAPLCWFGRNSYEVYLTHMFVASWGIQFFIAGHWTVGWSPFAYLLWLALAGALGALVARSFSEPINRNLRHRLGIL